MNLTQQMFLMKNYYSVCMNESTNVEEAWNCVQTGALDYQKVLTDTDNDVFTKDLTFIDAGFYYRYLILNFDKFQMSLSSKRNMFDMTSSMRTSYTFNLTSPYNASLILSDPNFFITNANPVAIPKVKIEINGDFGFRPFYISATNVKNMNTKGSV